MSTPTKKRYVPHNLKCFACGKSQGASFLGYDPRTLKSYCTRNCKNEKDIPKGIELVPMDTDSLLDAIHSNYQGDTAEMIIYLLGKPASVRLRPAHVIHLMKVSELKGIDKIQDALVDIIENDMQNRDLDDVSLPGSYFEEQEPEEEEPQPEPEKPKKKVEPEPVEEEEEKEEVTNDDGEDDDFTF